jgi:hypothetical protein
MVPSSGHDADMTTDPSRPDGRLLRLVTSGVSLLRPVSRAMAGGPRASNTAARVASNGPIVGLHRIVRTTP